jgi:hypothetical protein
MKTMELLEGGSVDTAVSQKPMGGLLNREEHLLYVVTETDVSSVLYPSTFKTILTT